MFTLYTLLVYQCDLLICSYRLPRNEDMMEKWLSHLNIDRSDPRLRLKDPRICDLHLKPELLPPPRMENDLLIDPYDGISLLFNCIYKSKYKLR